MTLDHQVNLLLEKNAQVNVRDGNGRQVDMSACANGRIPFDGNVFLVGPLCGWLF
jgi:ankyrin repeat protein